MSNSGGLLVAGAIAGNLTPGDGIANPTDALDVRALLQAWNGATFDRLRTPTVFKTVTLTAAGNTALWTPAAGKRFRLMAYSIEVTANAAMAAAGLNEVTLQDVAAAIGQGCSAWLPAAELTTLAVNIQLSGGMRQLGNGYLSSGINQTLNVNLATALTAGEVRVNAIGTEE